MKIPDSLRPLLRKARKVYFRLTGKDSHSRLRWLLARASLKGTGIEVGALFKPLPVPRGVTVRYVDRMDHEDLLKQYPELRGTPLVKIDLISDGETLREIPDESQDFVIANHFLEHCEDPFLTLKNFLRVTRKGGALFIALPDMRYTFDRDREETSYEHLIKDHREGPEGSRAAHFGEWVRFVGKVPESEHAAEVARLMDMRYSIHFHTFTPSGMLDILMRFRREDQGNFAVEAFMQNGDEFIFVLRKT
jgi:SAM-dependent methyltransferase